MSTNAGTLKKNSKKFKFFVKFGFEVENLFRFAAIFNVELMAVLTMIWSYVRTAIIV